MKNEIDEAEQPAKSAKNDQHDRGLVLARLMLTSVSAGQGAADGDGATEPQISFPPQPPLLDLFGLPQIEIASDFVEAGATLARERPLITQAEPPLDIVPEIEVVLTDLEDPADRSSPELQSQAAEPPSTLSNAPGSVDRDSLVTNGEAALARGDLAAARLLFGRAAVDGDARGARGMARAFDPETFRKLRVLGIRPDPDEAARWYARSDLCGGRLCTLRTASRSARSNSNAGSNNVRRGAANVQKPAGRSPRARRVPERRSCEAQGWGLERLSPPE